MFHHERISWAVCALLVTSGLSSGNNQARYTGPLPPISTGTARAEEVPRPLAINMSFGLIEDPTLLPPDVTSLPVSGWVRPLASMGGDTQSVAIAGAVNGVPFSVMTVDLAGGLQSFTLPEEAPLSVGPNVITLSSPNATSTPSAYVIVDCECPITLLDEAIAEIDELIDNTLPSGDLTLLNEARGHLVDAQATLPAGSSFAAAMLSGWLAGAALDQVSHPAAQSIHKPVLAGLGCATYRFEYILRRRVGDRDPRTDGTLALVGTATRRGAINDHIGAYNFLKDAGEGMGDIFDAAPTMAVLSGPDPLVELSNFWTLESQGSFTGLNADFDLANGSVVMGPNGRFCAFDERDLVFADTSGSFVTLPLDGTLLANADDECILWHSAVSSMRRFEISTGAELTELDLVSAPLSVAYSQDGTVLGRITVDDGWVRTITTELSTGDATVIPLSAPPAGPFAFGASNDEIYVLGQDSVLRLETTNGLAASSARIPGAAGVLFLPTSGWVAVPLDTGPLFVLLDPDELFFGPPAPPEPQPPLERPLAMSPVGGRDLVIVDVRSDRTVVVDTSSQEVIETIEFSGGTGDVSVR